MENAIEDNTCPEIPDNSTLQESILNEIWEKAMEVRSNAASNFLVLFVFPYHFFFPFFGSWAYVFYFYFLKLQICCNRGTFC